MGFLQRLNEYLLVMGVPGLALISFLDSAAIPMAGGPDAVILLLSWQRPGLMFLIAAAAALGSTLGCMVLYSIGKKGGERALSRFTPEKRAWVERQMNRNATLAIVSAVIAPPPLPTKLVILAAGVLQTGRIRFVTSVLAGRLLRYSLLAYLGARFGDEAAGILRANYPAISLALIGVILLVLLIRAFRGK